MKAKHIIRLGLGLAIGLIAGWLLLYGRNALAARFQSLTTLGSGSQVEGLESAPVVGAPVPDFTLQTLAGDRIHLQDLRGHPVLINFWATWCAPCRIEMPAIQAAYEAYRPDLVVLAVNFDESPEAVQAFVTELGLTFDILLDPGAEVNQALYQVRGYPSSYFIDREGVVRVVHIGLMTEGQLQDNLDRIGIGS